MPHVRALLCLLPAIVVEIAAQQVHVVDPAGPLQQIGSALAIAAPGDTIHVMPGIHAPFTVTIGCTIRGIGAGVQLADAGERPHAMQVEPTQAGH